MKRIVVIPKEHIEYEQISGAGFDTIRFHLGTDKTLEVPESFDEIKQLLHDNKDVFNKSVKKIEISTFMIEIHFKLQTFVFLHNGNIVEPNCLRPIVTNRTPQQMWQIIKGLIGEE